MNLSKLTSSIESAFTNPEKTFHRGAIAVPREPLDLDALVEDAVETEEDEDEIYTDGIEELLLKHGWMSSTLVAFYWQSLGPMVSHASLQTLTPSGGGQSFACWQGDDMPPYQVIARLKPAAGGKICRILFEKLIEDNGAAFGLQIFGSLPSNTHNMAEDLIPEETVRRCYWKWMLWAEPSLDDPWTCLAEEVSARARSPITYPLDLLKKLGAGMKGDPAAWLEERRGRDGRLTVRAKRAIFDAYFKQSYGPY